MVSPRTGLFYLYEAAAAVMYEGRKKLGAVQADRSKEIAEVKLFYEIGRAHV